MKEKTCNIRRRERDRERERETGGSEREDM